MDRWLDGRMDRQTDDAGHDNTLWPEWAEGNKIDTIVEKVKIQNW